MFSSFVLGSALLGLALAAPVIPGLEARQGSCAPIHIIAARGSTEKPGAGAIGSLAALIQQEHLGTDLEAVNYPALLIPYGYSSSAGTMAVTTQLMAYVNRCPNSKVILIGYSQVQDLEPPCSNAIAIYGKQSETQ